MRSRAMRSRAMRSRAMRSRVSNGTYQDEPLRGAIGVGHSTPVSE
jgi:hypothetical protein